MAFEDLTQLDNSFGWGSGADRGTVTLKSVVQELQGLTLSGGTLHDLVGSTAGTLDVSGITSSDTVVGGWVSSNGGSALQSQVFATVSIIASGHVKVTTAGAMGTWNEGYVLWFDKS